MTDRIVALTVTLDQNYRAEDIAPLMDAIRQFKGVLTVSAHVADPWGYTASVRAYWAIRDALSDALERLNPSAPPDRKV